MAVTIPLFPLSHVLLPGVPLPLNIFEDRYKQLLRDIRTETGHGSFGVVALRSGTEAVTPGTRNAGPDVEEVGTVAEILELSVKHDGSSELLAVGSQRFRILRLLPTGEPYLRAEVEYLREPDGPLNAELEDRSRDLMDVYDAMLIRLAGRGTGDQLPDDANQLSYHLAARLPLGPEERQTLLEDDSTASRLVHVTRLLRREIALLQRTRTIAVSPAVLRMITGTN